MGTASARPPEKPNDTQVRVNVVDEDGDPLRPAVVMACPYQEGSPNCDELVAAETKGNGVAKLKLQASQRYEFTAFVRDPEPPWACPGSEFNGGEFYFAENPFSADASDVPRDATLLIEVPTTFDCVPVVVTDDLGNALPAAGLIVCPLAADGTPCAAPSFDGPDPDGVIRLAVDPTVTYRLSAFLTNSGWPCPGYTDPVSGDTFHFSPERDVLGADLAGGATFVIHQPSAEECT